MNRQKLTAVNENLLIAIGYGDSVGLPVETKTRAEIQDQYGYIRELGRVDNPFFGSDRAGVWSDDTQLSLAMADALIDANGFSMGAIAYHHIKAMNETPIRQWEGEDLPRGWGKSTWESVARLKDGESPSTSGNPEGKGNGILMKLAPLAMWQTVTQPREADEQIQSLALMTHANDLSVVTALVHRDVLSGLLLGEIGVDNILVLAHECAKDYESEYRNAGDKTSSLLGQLAGLETVTVDGILKIANRGFHSSETLTMAYGAFVRQPDFPESVYEAVNYGGDTDSIGSIVASMSLMHSGILKQPKDLNQLAELDRLSKTGKALNQLVG